MATTNVPEATSAAALDLNKLTVAQLKALCKEKKISGYSKLGKGALIQKLTASGYSSSSVEATKTAREGGSNPARSEQAYSSRIGTEPTCAGSREPGLSHTNASTDAVKSTKPRGKKLKRKASNASISPSQGAIAMSLSSGLTASVDAPATGATATDVLSSQLLTTERLVQAPLAEQQTSQPFPLSTGDSSSPVDTRVLAETVMISSTTISVPHEELPFCGRGNELPKMMPKKRRADASSAPTVKKKQKTTSLIPGPKPTNSAGLSSAGAYSRFKVPMLPDGRPNALSLPPVSPAISSGSIRSPVLGSFYSAINAPIPPVRSIPAQSVLSTGKRLKKLVVAKHATPVTDSVSEVCQLRHSPEQANDLLALHYLDFPSSPPAPPLVPITLPPSLSQRKRVQNWAIILSGLSGKERRQCVLVSRMFRYAVYLSASHLLANDYFGERLHRDVIERYSQAMTNMWPYLQVRQREATERQEVYKKSFLATLAMRNDLSNPIADRLWASPDNERQLTIALRFVMSRWWFALSVGDGSGDQKTVPWLYSKVMDAKEVLKGEIWSITVASNTLEGQRPRMEMLYVLEATCEVVGRPTDNAFQDTVRPGEQAKNSVPVRADWSSYILQKLASQQGGISGRLLDLLKWANREEYDRGISRLWLKRVGNEGALGEAKRVVAERYVLACVVANSVSGQWMSTTEMAQDFAGLPAQMTSGSMKRVPSVNLYLPEHHHVESVHFTTSDGQPLHSALAIIQTPHREYYILRDNGMQVGCEEDGVAPVWRQVLKCDTKGIQS